MNSNPTNPADGKFVVVQNGQRVTGATDNQAEAQQEAERRNQLLEQAGKPVKEGQQAQVKQNIFG